MCLRVAFRWNWRELAGDLALFLGGTLLLTCLLLLWNFGDRLTTGLENLLWLSWLALLAGWLVGLLVLGWFGWLRLFGPVLFYDLVTVARRKRYLLLRFLYVGFLGFLLCWLYWMWSLEQQFRNNSQPSIQEIAELGEQFFVTFMIVQFIIVALLTPAYAAGVIADEKDRKTMEFLLATDLYNREIVLGKLLARVANLTLVILAGLPIFAVAQFFGGVDPGLLLAGYAALLLGVLGLCSLSILNSVYCRKARDAIIVTYMAAITYVGLGVLAAVLILAFPSIGALPSYQFQAPAGQVYSWTSPVTVDDVVSWFNAGNPVMVMVELGKVWGAVPLADVLPGMLAKYALFHVLATVLCVLLAVGRVRRVALKQGHGETRKLSLAARLNRPRVGRSPMFWKEVYLEAGLRLNWLGRIIIGVLVILSFVWPAWLIAEFLVDILLQTSVGTVPGYYISNQRVQLWEDLAENMNWWICFVGTTIACLALLGVAVRAASSISGERDKQTMDALLTSPLSAGDILFAKWLGCMLSVRWAWLWLGVTWAVGLVFGGLKAWNLPLLLVAWVVYAAVFTGIGLWYSAACKKTLWATIWTLVTVLFVGIGHWVVTFICCFLPVSALAFYMGGRDSVEWLAKIEFGQSPPLVLGLFAFHEPVYDHDMEDYWHLMASSVFGVLTWALAAVALWGMTYLRFLALSNREPHSPRYHYRKLQKSREAEPPPKPDQGGDTAEPPPVVELITADAPGGAEHVITLELDDDPPPQR